MSKNPPLSPVLLERVQSIIERYYSWEQLSTRANEVTTCFATESRVRSTCCEIHQGLHSMSLRLHDQAAALEDILIESQKIERRPCLFGSDFPSANTLIIIQRRDTGYSFTRFSVGWFEMIQYFFHPE